MYNALDIQTKLVGLVGFKNPANPEYAIVDANNQTAESNRYFTDNSYCKIENIKDTQDYKDITVIGFNEILTAINKKAITNVCDAVFSEPDYIDRQLLYRYANNKIGTEILPNGFVGYRLRIGNEKNIAFELRRVLLEFNGSGDIELHLYNTAIKAPLYSKIVTITSELQEVELNWVVNNSNYYKGEFYLGYFTSGLTVQPYERNYQASNIKSLITHLGVDNIKAIYTPSDTNIFDLSIVEGASECWGINFDVTIYNDYTDLIINNKRLFATAIQKQGQIIILSQFLASIRVNVNQKISHEYVNKIVFELEGVSGDSLKKTGIRQDFIAEINTLKQEIRKLTDGYFYSGFINITRT